MKSTELAKKIRIHAIELTHKTHASHVASILSAADIVSVLYTEIMNIWPDSPESSSRDRFVLSKGHAGISEYAALAELGFFELSRLDTYYQDGSYLSGHISHKNIPGVEFSTGSLGHGVSVATGMALAGKLENAAHHVYVLMGDGECEEGCVWESALFAAHNHLDNLTVVVDCNKFQALGRCEEQAGISSLADKWTSFGFYVVECDGHNHTDLKNALQIRKQDMPICVIANTIKGKGVSFMENELLWHYRDPQGEFYKKALSQLEETKNEKCCD